MFNIIIYYKKIKSGKMKDNIRFKNMTISSFIILIFLHISYSFKRESYSLLNNSKIILKINGSGPQRIFSDDYNGFPDSTKLKINNGMKKILIRILILMWLI